MSAFGKLGLLTIADFTATSDALKRVFQAFDPRLAKSFDAVPDAHRFEDRALSFDGEHPSLRFELVIPRLAGMKELRVSAARFVLFAEAVELPVVSRQGPVAKGGIELALGQKPAVAGTATLRKIEVRGMSVAPGANETFALNGGSSSVRCFVWTADAVGKVAFDASSSSSGAKSQLHLIVQPGNAPPSAAAPHFDVPGPANLYAPALAGAALQLGTPASSDLVLELQPPLSGEAATLVLGKVDDAGQHGGLPDKLGLLAWNATEVLGHWESSPAEVDVKASAAGTSAQVGHVPGVLPQNGNELSFMPAARSLLNAAYKASESGDLALAFDIASKTDGKCSIRQIDLTARYVAAPVPESGIALELRGASETARLALPPGATPSDAWWSFDGRFGPGLLLASSDESPRNADSGFRIAASQWVARRLAVSELERSLPLLRVGVFGRASKATEVLLTIHRADRAGVGAPIGAATSVQLEAASRPTWVRAELDARALPPDTRAIWVVAQVTRGVFWWYAEPTRTGETTLLSPDGGATWDVAKDAPLVQVHVLSEPIEPAPIRVHWSPGLLAENLLDGRATRAVLTASGGNAAPESFRLERSPLFAAEDFARIAQLGGELELVFTCARDVDLKLVNAEVLYDPWQVRSAG